MSEWLIWIGAFFFSSVLPGIAAKHVQEMRTRRNMETLEKEWEKMQEEKKDEK